MNSKKIVTLGDFLLRLSPPGHQRIVLTRSFEAHFGGGEANVAASLCNYGMQASFVTKLPDNPLGHAAISQLQAYGIDTRHIARGGERIGIYFLENGTSLRPSVVTYDRKHSSFVTAEPADFDFDAIFEGAGWFHATGITPALSDNTAAILRNALESARNKGITTSIDFNYRSKLWSMDEARKVMTDMAELIDICIDGETVLGFKEQFISGEEIDLAQYQRMYKAMQQQYNFKIITSSLRRGYNASHNTWGALIYDGQETHLSRRYDIQIVDRVGSGDAFSGGLIYGLINDLGPADSVEIGAAACALKHTIPGDFNQVSISEVLALVHGDGSGRVQR